MITLPNIGYLAFSFGILVYWTGTFLILYHLIRFGVSGQPKKIAATFLAGSLVLTMVTILLATQVDLAKIANITF